MNRSQLRSLILKRMDEFDRLHECDDPDPQDSLPGSAQYSTTLPIRWRGLDSIAFIPSASHWVLMTTRLRSETICHVASRLFGQNVAVPPPRPIFRPIV